MNKVEMNDRVKMRSRDRQELVQTRLRRKGLFKEKRFEFRVKMMRGQGKYNRGVESVAVGPIRAE